jgi:vacuolar-type H+-ATPase subunit H
MNGIQIERVLSLIDSNIDANMSSLHGEILNYLREHVDELAREISEKGYSEIQTHVGPVRISKEDMEPAAA